MCPKLWSRETLRFKGNKTNSLFPKGAVISCYVIYPIQRMNNLASFAKKVFLLYKCLPSDIPSNTENNKFN